MDMVITGQTDYGQTYGHGDYRALLVSPAFQ